jgi:branched-chain amino acid transport system permease protein
MEILQAALINGLIMGGIYALVAGGLTLIFGVMNFCNFAHGDFVMLALYMVVMFVLHFSIPFYVCLPLTVIAMGIFSILAYYTVIKPTLAAKDMAKICISVGLSFLFVNGIQLLFGADIWFLPPKASAALSKTILTFGGISIGKAKLIAFVISLLTSLIMYMVLFKTDFGLQMRAVTENRDTAKLMGVDVDRIFLYAWVIGIACCAIAASVLAPIYYASPTVGFSFTLLAFIIVIVAGLGDFIGALLAGVIIGMLEGIGAIYMPGSSGQMLIYAFFILMLVFRPRGIFSKGREVIIE